MELSQNQKVDYGYENGINIHRSSFRNGQEIGHITYHTDLEDLPEPITLESLNDRLKTFNTNVGRTAVQMSMFPSDKSDGALNIVLTGWQGNWNNNLARNEIRHILANQQTGSDTIFINHAGQGQSNTLPDHLSKEVAKTGKFQQLGEFYNDSLKSIVPNYDRVSVTGHSYGGRIAIALAASLDKKPSHLVISDSPGSENLTNALGVIKRFSSEGPNKTNYDKNNSGYNLETQLEFDRHPIRNMSEYIANSGWNGLVQLFNHQPSSLAHPTLEHDLSLAAPNVRDNIRITSPEFSKYNNPATVTDILKRVSMVNKLLLLNLDILKNHSHAFASGHPEVFGYIMRSNNH